MELIVIFLFLIFGIALLALGKMFDNLIIIMIGGIMLSVIGFSTIAEGYGTNETTVANSILNYTYNATITSNDLTSINTNLTKTYVVKYNLVSQAFGMIIALFGLVFAFDGAISYWDVRKNRRG